MANFISLRLIRQFIKLESSAGIVLFLAAILALIVDNTAWAPYYESFFRENINIWAGPFKLEKPLLLWINDGFMAVFFLLVGLEIKREILEGELNSLAKISLPLIAATGGMLVPAAIYIVTNWHDPLTIKGWAIPTATDTAFSLGILSLLGKRIPVTLKIFLTALAIFDDMGAIIIMAFFYSTHVSMGLLICVGFLVGILLILNYCNVQNLIAYLLVGLLLWFCVLKSGIHATLAGIILAFLIPIKTKKMGQDSPLHILEDALHPWVAWVILPIFAFANAGVSFRGMTPHHFLETIPLGIALGLFFGKQVGIWGATLLGVRCGVSQLPRDVTPLGLYGMSLIAGVGFTMSLFIGTLAFHSVAPYAAFVRMGVVMGSFLSGLAGYLVLRHHYK